MIDTNYSIEALEILLDSSCLPGRFDSLLPYKTALLSGFRLLGCRTKKDAAELTDEDYARIGLKDTQTVRLMRRFLALYDPNPAKFREIPKVVSAPEERAAYEELYCLPGVKAVRAALYYQSGYRSIRDFAAATTAALLEKTAKTIETNSLPCTAPLPKEVRTQIAVARAFLWAKEMQGT